MTRDELLHAIIREAAAARSALCENELVIRLDNILALAQGALGTPDPSGATAERDRLRVENAARRDLLSEVGRHAHGAGSDPS